MNAVTTTAFDYTALPQKTAEMLRAAVSAIRTVQRSAVIEVGDHLIAAKVALEHGAFGAWLDAEFQMSERTAHNYMNAAKFLAGKSAKFALLPPSAVYALAAPSAPPEVVAEVQAEVEAGAVPKVAEIRERIAGVTKAQQAAANAKSADQIKREKENEKRRRAAQAERDRKEREEREAAEAARNLKAQKAAAFLVSGLGAQGTYDLLEMLRGTDWHLVERRFRNAGLIIPVAEIEKKFKGELEAVAPA